MHKIQLHDNGATIPRSSHSPYVVASRSLLARIVPHLLNLWRAVRECSLTCGRGLFILSSTEMIVAQVQAGTSVASGGH